MADNILVKDGAGVNRTLKTTETGGVHTPHQIVTGPLTDAQLRNSAVAVSGPLTDAQLRNSAVPVSGPVTNAQIRAEPLDVEGPLTDAELRAAAVGTYVKEVPLSVGVFEVDAGGGRAIVIPVGAVGLRIFPRDVDVLFNLGAAPGAPTVNTLAAGGIAKSGEWKSLYFGSASALHFLSTESPESGSDPMPALVDVEFFA